MSKMQLHPQYAITMEPDPARRRAVMQQFDPPEELELLDILIPAEGEQPALEARVYRPQGAKGLPVVMDVHGGGWRAGSYHSDNNRCADLALKIPAVVVSVNYRLLPEHPFPEPLLDCYHAWRWLFENAESLGGDRERMGLFGTSAGGNLCAGLAFYVRDHGGPRIRLNALNVPAVGIGPCLSAEQRREKAPVMTGEGLSRDIWEYAGGANGHSPSYYAVPNLAPDFADLPPTLVITAEYDPLRDYGMEYVQHLLRDAVPVELYMMPRVGHGFDNYRKPPMTKWLFDGIVLSFRREFGLLEEI